MTTRGGDCLKWTEFWRRKKHTDARTLNEATYFVSNVLGDVNRWINSLETSRPNSLPQFNVGGSTLKRHRTDDLASRFFINHIRPMANLDFHDVEYGTSVPPSNRSTAPLDIIEDVSLIDLNRGFRENSRNASEAELNDCISSLLEAKNMANVAATLSSPTPAVTSSPPLKDHRSSRLVPSPAKTKWHEKIGKTWFVDSIAVRGWVARSLSSCLFCCFLILRHRRHVVVASDRCSSPRKDGWGFVSLFNVDCRLAYVHGWVVWVVSCIRRGHREGRMRTKWNKRATFANVSFEWQLLIGGET
ncbi:unnamed protein product [Lactuca saligna]|uniref:Uncharacterized protein n=1 Tax=Lactuca saligna TaxID=75948 RepID=A0AA35VPY4_LACSI|nr:unnamed protein product [Lactuca saligna]